MLYFGGVILGFGVEISEGQKRGSSNFICNISQGRQIIPKSECLVSSFQETNDQWASTTRCLGEGIVSVSGLRGLGGGSSASAAMIGTDSEGFWGRNFCQFSLLIYRTPKRTPAS